MALWFCRFRCLGAVVLVLFGNLLICRAQAPLALYSDVLTNGFEDWSWAPHNLANTTPAHSGGKSISVSAAAWQGISFHHPEFGLGRYSHFSFWAHGGSSGGQKLRVYAETSSGAAAAYDLAGSLTANAWTQFNLPLQSLGVANVPNFNRITVQLRGDGGSGTFYLDDIQFTAFPVPALVNVTVNAMETVRLVDQRHFGVNLAVWDSYYNPPYYTDSIALLKEMGATVVRMPGGSLSDEYHWASNTSLSNTWQWNSSFDAMIHVTTNVPAQAFITVNYGTGTPEEAAAWVRHANVTNQLGYKYWEIGNECYGTWETDSNTFPHDPYTYARRASNYIAQMKLADPGIKVGVVALPGETANDNGYTNHPAYNPRTGQTTYGWTPVMLATLKSMGVTPDFLVHHQYPEWTDPHNASQSPDNDVTLLDSTGNWGWQAADLRQQITDYFGAGGSNIELVVTENNSDAGAQGKQSTSLVNALYYADGLARLLQTEFNGFLWWDFRNGSDTAGYFGSNVYGWRSFGDIGMVNGISTRLPAFYAAKLMQWFARPGEKVLAASSDYAVLGAYAARHTNGSVSVLLINKSASTNLTAQVGLAGFASLPNYTIRSYGIANDEAARTNAATGQDITVSSGTAGSGGISLVVPAYSILVVTFTPATPALAVLPAQQPGKFVFELQAQPEVPYVLQSSADLRSWSPVWTNTLPGSTWSFTNTVTADAPVKFWRAVWEP